MSPTGIVPQVPLWVSPFVGMPFVSRGRGAAGVDCWGLVLAIHRARYGAELPRWDDYDDTNDGEHLAHVVAAALPSFDRVAIPKEGDVVLFRIVGHLCHVGVVVAEPWFIHAREDTRGAVIERLDSISWSRRVEGFYRWRR